MDLLIEKALTQLSVNSYKFKTNQAWASTKKNYRLELRKSLSDSLLAFSNDLKLLSNNFDPSEILDLQKTPLTDNFSISISHCNLIGGYIILPKAKFIGLDFENAERISSKTLFRIANAKDDRVLLNKPILWSAKEASFKCFQNQKIISHVISDIWIKQTNNIDEIIYFSAGLSASKSPQAQGFCFIKDNITIAISIS